MDLHVEHINRVIKSAIHSQFANLSPAAIVRTSRCTGSLFNICQQFDKVTDIHVETNTHSKAKLEADISRIVKQLHEISKVFDYHPNRKHAGIKNNISGSIINGIDKDKLITWIKKHLRNLSLNP